MSDNANEMPAVVGVLLEIRRERIKQDAKWGEQNHHPFTYLAVLGEEVGEANQAALQSVYGGKAWPDYRKGLVHVAAVAVAMIECLDRHDGAPPPDGTEAVTLSSKVARMRRVLEVLDSQGGLGSDRHAWIKDALE